MRKAGSLILILLLSQFLLFAQEDDPSEEIDWDNVSMELYTRGDRSLMISLGVVFPTIWRIGGSTEKHQIDPPVGGTGSIGLSYYLSPKLIIGGEIGGMFLPTIADHTLYMIYLGARAGTQFITGRFEFPIGVSFGMAWQKYLDLGYFGMYIKAGGSALFRATTNWGFGLSANWFIFPEWTGNSRQNAYAHFLDLTLSARYHF